jgi:hypothetical protein
VFQINSDEVIVSNEPATIVRSAQAAGAAGDTTLYTTPGTGDFYLTNAALQLELSSTGAETGNVELKITIDGVERSILVLRGQTIAASDILNSSNSLNLQNPIKIDKSTAIHVTSASLGMVGNATIVGYILD